jgi:hypothetical protein
LDRVRTLAIVVAYHALRPVRVEALADTTSYVSSVKDQILAIAVRINFAVHAVYVAGQLKTTKAAVLEAVALACGDVGSYLLVSLAVDASIVGDAFVVTNARATVPGEDEMDMGEEREKDGSGGELHCRFA